MSKKDVFLSYKSEEFDSALWLKKVLETNGISCWMAPMSIRGGSNYAQSIPTAIANCKVFVLMLSRKAQDSQWISKEVNQALNEKKIIMPYMIENCELQNEFNFYLSDIQRYEAYKNKVQSVEKMVREIWAVLNVPTGKREVIIPPTDGNDTGGGNDKVDSGDNPKYIRKAILWLALAYIFCLPAAVFATIAFLFGVIGGNNLRRFYILTKYVCIIGSIVGGAVFVYALGSYDACSEAMWASLIGIICELIFA